MVVTVIVAMTVPVVVAVSVAAPDPTMRMIVILRMPMIVVVGVTVVVPIMACGLALRGVLVAMVVVIMAVAVRAPINPCVVHRCVPSPRPRPILTAANCNVRATRQLPVYILAVYPPQCHRRSRQGAPDRWRHLADRGAVRFDFPRGWVSVPQEGGSIRLCDKVPPDDDCALEVSVMHLPPIDWSDLSLAYLLRELKSGPEERGPVTWSGEIVEEKRGDLDIAWKASRWIDPTEKREACSFFCLARRKHTQILLTFDYWLDDEPRFGHVWRDALDSLNVGEQPPGLGRRGSRF